MSERKIVVLGTGGTIAGRAASAQDNVGYQAAQVGVADLLRGVPGLQGHEFACEQVAQVDSKDMDFAVWRALAGRCAHWLAQPDVAGIVVTHGTDTMEETAYFLHRVLGAGKPVVLTGAMRPATSLAADGPQNLVDAVTLAGTAGARGVMVCFAGVVHGPLEVAKVHPYRMDAFASGEAGPLAVVEEGRVRALRPWPEASAARDVAAWTAQWPRVEIVTSYAGGSAAVVDALVAHGVDGIVLAGTGNGTLHHALLAAAARAQAQGVRMLRTTRCATGRVLPLPGDAVPAAEGLSPVKARIALMLELLG